MMVALHDIHWITAYRLWYLVLFVSVLLGIRVYQAYKRWRAVTILTGKGNRKDLLVGFSWLREVLKLFFLAFGLVLCVIALLRPAWGHDETETQVEGRQVYIALDVSKSMRAQDIGPSRLEAAKNKIMRLLSQLACEQVGLILFSGSAFVQCPLTTDYGTLRLFLDAVDVESIASGTTALDKAIITATQAFKRSESAVKSKLLVVCTDGEDFSKGAMQAGAQAAQNGIHVITLGVASQEGAPIPLDEVVHGSGYQKDEQGAIVISRLDSRLLTELADVTGGSFVQATDDDVHDVAKLKVAIEQFEREQLCTDTSISFIERYWPFVVGGFASFIAWVLL